MRSPVVANRGSTLVGVIVALALLAFAQHKIDQMRAIGYGRLNYSELRSAGIIDASPATMPYSFRGADGLDTYFPSPSGTIAIAATEEDIRMVTINITWAGHSHTGGDVTLTALISRD
jgi:hypothetical protein